MYFSVTIVNQSKLVEDGLCPSRKMPGLHLPKSPALLFAYGYSPGGGQKLVSIERLTDCHHVAQQAATFHDGIVFSSWPMELYKKVTLKILKEDLKWHRGLRVGFTWKDPSLLEPSELTPFACPHLVQSGNTRVCLLLEE
ncbi:hypothetical protein JRQ81_010638 [Phrynocephalus forsythii]|uniref:NHR domain-containing protein n=1 Tax=Phrynocephalus forsythii TaxID=171643 RepID=A0A9Q0X7Y4_9SAUR|nr:hypothetical protein JRQ81_010638 [Phrynocephalus forsythii]